MILIKLKPKTLPISNNHLPEPFKHDEVVKFIGENPVQTDNPAFDQQFIQIERLKSKRVEVFYRNYFFDLKTKKSPEYQQSNQN